MKPERLRPCPDCGKTSDRGPHRIAMCPYCAEAMFDEVRSLEEEFLQFAERLAPVYV